MYSAHRDLSAQGCALKNFEKWAHPTVYIGDLPGICSMYEIQLSDDVPPAKIQNLIKNFPGKGGCQNFKIQRAPFAH